MPLISQVMPPRPPCPCPRTAAFSCPTRPHITLAGGPTLPELDLKLPIPITLDGVLHVGRSWLAWRVDPSPALAAMQHAVRLRMDDPNPLHNPGLWVPHVSLARRAPADLDLRLEPRHGLLVAARSYDTETRTVSSIVVCRSPAPER
jgi:hypothetical protein